MKRRPLVVSAVGLLLSIFGVSEFHQRRAEQKSAEFRQAFLRYAPLGEFGRVATVGLDDSSAGQLGTWEGVNLDEVLSDVHLMPAPGGEASVSKSLRGFRITTVRSQVGFADGIYLSITSDEGFYMLPDENLKGWVLSPASCRAIKRRIWAEFGAKLRSLSIPPAQ